LNQETNHQENQFAGVLHEIVPLDVNPGKQIVELLERVFLRHAPVVLHLL
jgi:hypothetical protein